MHPHFQHQLTQTRIADLHAQAEHRRIARNASQARRADRQPAARPFLRPRAALRHLLSAVLAG